MNLGEKSHPTALEAVDQVELPEWSRSVQRTRVDQRDLVAELALPAGGQQGEFP